MGETPILGTPHFGNPLQWQVLPVIPGRPRGSSLELRTPGIGSAGADHEWSMMMSGWFMNGWLLIYLVDIYIYIIMYIYILFDIKWRFLSTWLVHDESPWCAMIFFSVTQICRAILERGGILAERCHRHSGCFAEWYLAPHQALTSINHIKSLELVTHAIKSL